MASYKNGDQFIFMPQLMAVNSPNFKSSYSMSLTTFDKDTIRVFIDQGTQYQAIYLQMHNPNFTNPNVPRMISPMHNRITNPKKEPSRLFFFFKDAGALDFTKPIPEFATMNLSDIPADKSYVVVCNFKQDFYKISAAEALNYDFTADYFTMEGDEATTVKSFQMKIPLKIIYQAVFYFILRAVVAQVNQVEDCSIYKSTNIILCVPQLSGNEQNQFIIQQFLASYQRLQTDFLLPGHLPKQLREQKDSGRPIFYPKIDEMSIDFVAEPVAGAYHVQQKAVERVLILDIGAGTTDVAALSTTINTDGDKTIAPISGGHFKCCVGGADIDNFIINQLKLLISRSIYYSVFKNAFIEQLLQSELKKNLYRPDSQTQQTTFTLVDMNYLQNNFAKEGSPEYLFQFLKHVFSNFNKNTQLQDYFSVQYDQHELSPEILDIVEKAKDDKSFDPSLIDIMAKPKIFYDALQHMITKIMTSDDEQKNNPFGERLCNFIKKQNIDQIYLIGGLFQDEHLSNSLQIMIKESLTKAGIKVPMEVGQNPGMAVINGALVYGKEKHMTESGIGKKTKHVNMLNQSLGVAFNEKFDEGKHNALPYKQLLKKQDVDGVTYVTNQVKLFVKKGQQVDDAKNLDLDIFFCCGSDAAQLQLNFFQFSNDLIDQTPLIDCPGCPGSRLRDIVVKNPLTAPINTLLNDPNLKQYEMQDISKLFQINTAESCKGILYIMIKSVRLNIHVQQTVCITVDTMLKTKKSEFYLSAALDTNNQPIEEFKQLLDKLLLSYKQYLPMIKQKINDPQFGQLFVLLDGGRVEGSQ